MLVLLAVVFPVLNAHGLLSDYTITLWGKYLCYALLAISVDLLWGYTGLLSLGQALFFSLGGYMFGMYLMLQIGMLGSYAKAGRIRPAAGFHGLPRPHVPAAVLAAVPVLRVRPLMVLVTAGPAGARFRLPGVPLAHQGRVFLHPHPGADLRGLPHVFPERLHHGRQQRLHRFQVHPRPLAGGQGGRARDDARTVRRHRRGAAAGLPRLPLAQRHQVRPRAPGDPGRREPRAVQRLRHRQLQAFRLRRRRDDRRRRAARCLSRRPASSTRTR
jgi:hypothetical protein